MATLPQLTPGKGEVVRSRFVALSLTLMVVISAAACGSSSKSQTASTATAPATTATATTATATTSSSNSPSSAQAAVCTQAIADLQPLQAAASTNNASQIEAAAGRAASKINALQSRPGITAETHAALGQLTGALEAFAHGARGQAISTQLSTAGQKLAVACK